MKALIKRVAGSGYEICQIQPCLTVDGDFEMANRNYRPAVLQYRRSKYGDDQRLKYIVNFLDLRGPRTLEPGPFGGHHSVLLEMGVPGKYCHRKPNRQSAAMPEDQGEIRP